MTKNYYFHHYLVWGPGERSECSHSLWAGRSGGRILVVARFLAPIQTVPMAHPSSCIMGCRVFYPRVNRPTRGVDHPPSSSTRVKERVELYLHSPSVTSWQVIGNLYLYDMLLA